MSKDENKSKNYGIKSLNANGFIPYNKGGGEVDTQNACGYSTEMPDLMSQYGLEERIYSSSASHQLGMWSTSSGDQTVKYDILKNVYGKEEYEQIKGALDSHWLCNLQSGINIFIEQQKNMYPIVISWDESSKSNESIVNKLISGKNKIK